jgi:hypothetical protein
MKTFQKYSIEWTKLYVNEFIHIVKYHSYKLLYSQYNKTLGGTEKWLPLTGARVGINWKNVWVISEDDYKIWFELYKCMYLSKFIGYYT